MSARPQCRAHPRGKECPVPKCGMVAERRAGDGRCFFHSEEPVIRLERALWRWRVEGRKG